jgi:hypothetical protein
MKQARGLVRLSVVLQEDALRLVADAPDSTAAHRYLVAVGACRVPSGSEEPHPPSSPAGRGLAKCRTLIVRSRAA